MIPQMRVVVAEIVAADDAVLFPQPFVDLCCRKWELQDELFEKRLCRRVWIHREAVELADFRCGVMALVKAELGNPSQAPIAHGCKIDRGAERAQRGIGADVARRLGAADVL